MRLIKIIAVFFVPLVLLTGCFGSRELKESSKTALSENEFIYNAYFLEGLRLKTIGSFEESLANLEKAREYNPEDAVLHYQLAEVNTQLGNYRAAIHYAENAVALDAENVWYHVLLVQLYQNSSMFSKATGEMEEIIRIEPNRLDFYFMLSALYQAIGDTKAALKTMDRAEKEFGITDIITVEKETIYLEAGKGDKAEKEVQKLIDKYPEQVRYKALLAELYLSLKQPEKARKVYEMLYVANISDGGVLLAMSEFYRSNREYGKAFDLLKRAFADENLSIDIKIEMLVSILTTSGTSNEELRTQHELMDVLIETHPADPKALTIYSDFLVKAGDYEQARNIIRTVLKTTRDKYLIWEQLLYVNNHLMDFESLFSDSDTIIQMFPVQPIPYVFNSMAAFQLNKHEKAIESATTGLKYAGEDKAIKSELLTFLGEANYRIKNFESSDSAFVEVLKLDPENVYVLNNFAYYLSLRKEKLEKAEEMGRKLVSLMPLNPSYLDTFGWVLFVKGEYNEAERYLKSALDNGGEKRAAILDHYGDVLFKLEKRADALEYWQKALELSEGKQSEEIQKKIETGEL